MLESWESLTDAYELDLNDGSAPQSSSAQTVEDEFNAYVQVPLSPKGTDLMKFWDAHSQLYKTFFTLALDYHPIQATSVPSECLFASSLETDTKCQN